MESVEAITGTDYLDDFDLGRFDRLIDIGGSNGEKALTILKRYPQMQALVFDRPQVIDNATAYWHDKVDAELLARKQFPLLTPSAISISLSLSSTVWEIHRLKKY